MAQLPRYLDAGAKAEQAPPTALPPASRRSPGDARADDRCAPEGPRREAREDSSDILANFTCIPRVLRQKDVLAGLAELLPKASPRPAATASRTSR